MVGSVLLYLGGLRPCSEGQAGKERHSASAVGHLQCVSLPAFHSPRGACLQGTALPRSAAIVIILFSCRFLRFSANLTIMVAELKVDPRLLQSG